MNAEGHAAIEGWRASKPATFYDSALDVLDAETVERLRSFGAVVAQVVDPAVARVEARRDLPAVGPDESVAFDDAYSDAGRAVWASGVVGARAPEQAALLYLLAHAGEGGHACPVVCTAGLVRALRTHASAELRDRFLPPLLVPDYDRSERGAQFLTEIQGGSDVGANRVLATPAGDASWRISGEKWFCSVADADQFVVTARRAGAPEGTRGIGCFLVPRRLDGRVNGFRLRRLKDKLGTRALATGEIEFDGAVGYALGAPEEGFRIAAGVVLNTSRWLNAFGSAGLMRRAYIEASSFARSRVAFDRPIADFPLVRENVAVMRAEAQAALASSLALTELVEGLDDGTASADDVVWHRILVNANKFVTSLAATSVVRRGIEALGGNGTIEDFSPLPRLYRDAIVFESWEGTHNVLCAQVLRDLARLDAVDVVLARLPSLDAELARRLRASAADPDGATLHFRRQLAALVRTLQVEELARGSEPRARAAAELIRRRHLVRGWDPEADPEYASLVEQMLEPELVAQSH